MLFIQIARRPTSTPTTGQQKEETPEKEHKPEKYSGAIVSISDFQIS